MTTEVNSRDKQFDIVFEGGGAKGSVFVGALEILDAAGFRHRRLLGTSAGAITATLLAAGYTPKQMLEAVNEKQADGRPRFAAFMDHPAAKEFIDEPGLIAGSVTKEAFERFPLRNYFGIDERIIRTLLHGPHYCQLFSFVECGGLFSGEEFRRWFETKLDEIGKLTGNGVTGADTFAEFNRKTGRDLSLVASDVTAVEMLVLNHRTAPLLPVARAVRMSMSIPFVWREVAWKPEWGQYDGRDKVDAQTGKGNIIVDGGVLSNFPIRLIAEEPEDNDLVRKVMGEEMRAADAANLGLLIDETLPVKGYEKVTKPESLVGRFRTAHRVSSLVDTMTQAGDSEWIHQREAEICRLPALGYGTTEFDMKPERLGALVEAGRAAMREHLATRFGIAVPPQP